MPLSIPLPARAKVIINGAVIENSGSANISLTVHNKAYILRDKDVITQAEADTPAKEIYHSVQNAYLFEANKDEWMHISLALLQQFQRHNPAAAEIVAHVTQLLHEDKLYNALRATRRLIAFEEGKGDGPAGSDPKPSPDPKTPLGPKSPAPDKARNGEIGRIKDQIAELERRIAALDNG